MCFSREQFWKGITILLNNYHAVNRKIFACTIVKVEKIKDLHNKETELNNFKEDFDKTLLIPQLLQIAKDDVNKIPIAEGFIVHLKCIPKKGGNTTTSVGIMDLLNSSFSMTFEDDLILDFEIKLNDGKVAFNIINHSTSNFDPSMNWLEFVLKPKFINWCRNQDVYVGQMCGKINDNSSLRLIDIEKYNQIYNDLKIRYSGCAMKLWNDAKECTDPLKYIYEDLAIAAYLITLWRSDLVRKPPLAFADLGCGNGLLVYILINEGYQGYGYDIRRRKLWSLYPIDIASHLYEEAIEPFKFNLPGEVDWLIGNHSDELSAWIPVLAGTCGKNLNYFLLPCCAFELSGIKFQRRNSSVSVYKDFCSYVERVSNICGFETKKDRLKIPSTKRTALIGISVIHLESEQLNRIVKVKEFVRNEQQKHPNTTSEEIKLREKIETVRNCTKIDKSIIDKLVAKIFTLLLEDTNNPVEKSYGEDNWRMGGRLSISEIAKALDKIDLKNIKAECGGLKTLLRNKHEIFEFESSDLVKIRKPKKQLQIANKPQTIKKRACFFKLQHPQGCPLTSEECTFVH